MFKPFPRDATPSEDLQPIARRMRVSHSLRTLLDTPDSDAVIMKVGKELEVDKITLAEGGTLNCTLKKVKNRSSREGGNHSSLPCLTTRLPLPFPFPLTSSSPPPSFFPFPFFLPSPPPHPLVPTSYLPPPLFREVAIPTHTSGTAPQAS